MIYRNTKTGAVIDSSCVISGGDWVKEGWAVTAEEDGKIHVRPTKNGEKIDTLVEKVEKPKPKTRKR
jgi:hypothetical protein